MSKRVIFGAIMIAVMGALLLADHWIELRVHQRLRQRRDAGEIIDSLPHFGAPLAAAGVIILVPAFREMARLAAGAGIAVLGGSGLFACLVLGTLPFWWRMTDRTLGGPDVLAVMGVLCIVVFGDQIARRSVADALRRLAATLMTVVYLGVGLAMILQIRLSFGVPALGLFLLAVKFTDIAAYFTGKAAGRHKLIPFLSPAKTWEGLIGGLAGGVGISILGARLMGPWELTPVLSNLAVWQAAAFGGICAVFGQFADLCESLLKRAVSLKDSGRVVPEFGGVLDIIDSPLLSAPVAYLFLAASVGWS